MLALTVRLLRPLLGTLLFRGMVVWTTPPRPVTLPGLPRLHGKASRAGAAPAKEILSRETLAAALGESGLSPGQIVLVHASLRRIGAMTDGAATLVAALREVVGDEGTIVVPTFTSWNSDTSRTYHAHTSRMGRIRAVLYRWAIPAFDVDKSSSIECGQLSEYLRRLPGAVRSAHPQTSFAALGRDAQWLMSDHALESHLGERSPLAKLFDAKAQVLLLGVGFDKCTAFHLAEYRYQSEPPSARYGCAMKVDGRSTWCRYTDVVLDDSDFHECGQDMERTVYIENGLVGNAVSRCFPLVEAVEYAKDWIREHRHRPPT
jgi:aminoglycoside 3-N-acetyltransferase